MTPRGGSGWQGSLSRSAKLSATERDDGDGSPPYGRYARVTAGHGLAGTCAHHMVLGAAMTDDDTNEETARPPLNDVLPAI